jgi:hypothetical protein
MRTNRERRGNCAASSSLSPADSQRVFFFFTSAELARRFIAVAPRNLQQPLLQQKPQQTMVDHERTLGHRKKLPAGKSEPTRALVGSSSARLPSRFTAALPRMPRLFLPPKNFSRSPSLTLFLNYMSSRDLEQFDKPLKLRCPWILEPSLASVANALQNFWPGSHQLIVTFPKCIKAPMKLLDT